MWKSINIPKLLISVLILGIVSLLSWNLLQTYSMGKTTVPKLEFQQHETENREDFKETQRMIQKNQENINKGLSEIKNLIIDKLGE